jgi:hypothetical protein
LDPGSFALGGRLGDAKVVARLLLELVGLVAVTPTVSRAATERTASSGTYLKLLREPPFIGVARHPTARP